MREGVFKNNMFVQANLFTWTQHVKMKIRFYGLSESRVKRVIRHPDRIEEGVAPFTVACMQKAGTLKNPQEIWSMYQTKTKNQVRVISAWRYPGVSPKKNPIPQDILDEILGLLE